MKSNLTFNITLIGNRQVGKSSIIFRFQQRQYPLGYKPTNDYFIPSRITIDDQTIKLKIYDRDQSETYEKFRSKAYPRSDGFIICFSLADGPAFNFVESVWVREIMQYYPEKPYILVGTKSDSRKSISKSKGVDLKNRISADAYVECSALNDTNIIPVFEAIVNAIIIRNHLREDDEKKKKCCLLI